MFNFIKKHLKYKLAKEELSELRRWRVFWEHYRRWLNPIPVVAATLDNMDNEVRGGMGMCASHPPSSRGPWDVDGLRRQLMRAVDGEVTLKNVGENQWLVTETIVASENAELRKQLEKTNAQLTAARELLALQESELKAIKNKCGDALHSIGRIVETGIKPINQN